MPHTDCDDLRARSEMLHVEAELGREQAEEHGKGWTNYEEQLQIADHFDLMATGVEAKITEDC